MHFFTDTDENVLMQPDQQLRGEVDQVSMSARIDTSIIPDIIQPNANATSSNGTVTDEKMQGCIHPELISMTPDELPVTKSEVVPVVIPDLVIPDFPLIIMDDARGFANSDDNRDLVTETGE